MNLVRLPLLAASLATLTLVPAATGWADDAAVLAQGQQLYATCTTCHGADGKGMKIGELAIAPSLHGSEFVQSDDPQFLALLILKGIKKENDQYVQQMIGLEGSFDDEQLAAVMSYARQTFGGHTGMIGSNDASEFRKRFRSVSPLITRKKAEALLKAPVFGGVSDLKFAAYEGNFKRLPVFRDLTPVADGAVDSNVLDLAVVGKDLIKKNFALTFDGNFEIPRTGQFRFRLMSDDGSRLFIDGEAEIQNDGIHGATTKETRMLTLEEGIHSFRIEYFEGGGGEELAFAVEPKGGLMIDLAKQKLGKGGGGAKQQTPTILLTPDASGEAVVYRNFIAGTLPRGIAVGYPGGVNLCWDADSCGLSQIWRGAFMSAGRHWTGRGQGSEPPLGVDVVQPADGLPFQVFSSPEAAWVDFSKATIKHDRDNPNPQKEMTYNAVHPDYRFLGYQLDSNRFPTFRYRFQKLVVEEAYAPGNPADNDGRESLFRTLNISGTPEKGTFLRVGKGGTFDNGVLDQGTVRILVAGAQPQLQQENLVVPVNGSCTIRVEYRWTSAIAPPVVTE